MAKRKAGSQRGKGGRARRRSPKATPGRRRSAGSDDILRRNLAAIREHRPELISLAEGGGAGPPRHSVVRLPGGELDLVAEHDDTIVVVEVRKRSDSRFGDAADSVDHHKQRKLIHAAGMLLQKHPQWEDRPLRFDVVGIDREQITWIQDAFQA